MKVKLYLYLIGTFMVLCSCTSANETIDTMEKLAHTNDICLESKSEKKSYIEFKCNICNGDRKCFACNGKGRKYFIIKKCEVCHGTGKCIQCNGTGLENKSHLSKQIQ